MAIVLKFKTESRAAVRGMKQAMDKGKRELREFSRATSREAKKARGEWRAFNKTLSKVGLSYKRIGIAAGAMAVAGIYALGRLSSASISAASSLEEIESKFNVVFKGVEDVAKKTTDQLTEGWGFARASAMQWMSTMQDLLVPMGLASDKAAELSGEIVKLSIDTGSFNDIPTADVMRDFQSALVGNHETVRKYGIQIGEAELKTAALTQGINKSWKEMTSAEKVMLRWSIIVKDSTFAAGDFIRTQGGWANQSRILQERQTELLSAIGAPLINALSSVQPKIRAIVDDMIDWVDQNDKLIEQGMTTVVDEITKSAETAASIIKTVAEYWRLAAIGAAITRGEGDKIIEYYKILQSEQEGTNEGLDYQRDRTGEILGFYEGMPGYVKTLNEELEKTTGDLLPQFVGALKNSWNVIDGMKSDSLIFADHWSVAGDNVERTKMEIIDTTNATVGLIKKTKEVDALYKDWAKDVEDAEDLIEEEVTGAQALSGVFSVLNLQSSNFTMSLREQVGFMRTMHSILSMVSGIFGLFSGGFSIFHAGGMVNRIPGSAPGYAPPGTRQYHSGGVQMGADERLGRFKVGESVINPFGTAMLGQRGVAALNAGQMPSGGSTFNINIYNPIGTEEYFTDNIIPFFKKAVTELNMEVWASDTIRSRSLS